ncbi:MAG: hypothetical protein QXG02_04310 [Candidatus Anstonellales archaeon]
MKCEKKKGVVMRIPPEAWEYFSSLRQESGLSLAEIMREVARIRPLVVRKENATKNY